jgi:hypothetical protein
MIAQLDCFAGARNDKLFSRRGLVRPSYAEPFLTFRHHRAKTR